MTVEELKKKYEYKINALKEEFDNEIAELQKENKRWKPEVGEKYYYINAGGVVVWETWYEDSLDDGYFNYYNVFKTKEEAEFAAERWKVMRELEMLADDDKEWDGNYDHYAIKYYNGVIRCDTRFFSDRTHPFYFKSEESAQKAADRIGKDRLEKYYFKVRGGTRYVY